MIGIDMASFRMTITVANFDDYDSAEDAIFEALESADILATIHAAEPGA